MSALSSMAGRLVPAGGQVDGRGGILFMLSSGVSALTRTRLAFLLVLLMAPALRAQAPLDYVPEGRLERLSKGIALFGWGPAGPLHPYQNPQFVTKADVDALRLAGFTYGRLVLFWGEFAPSLSSPFASNEALVWLDGAIDLLVSNGLGAMVCFWDQDPRLVVPDRPDDVDKYNELWRTVASRYRSRDPERVFFEILNEPGAGLTEATWEPMQQRFAATIRGAAPTHTIIATSANYSSISDFVKLLPLEDRNVVYTFHFYPSGLNSFIFQGHTCCGATNEKIKGLPYPSYLPEVDQFLRGVADSEVRQAVERYIAEVWWSGHIESIFARAAGWRRQHQRPIVMNEFNLSTIYAPPESRREYVWDVRRAAEKYGIGWLAWNYASGADSLTVTQGDARIPDPLLMQALGLTPWGGPVVSRPDLAFYGADTLTSDPVAQAGAVVSAMTATDLDGDGRPDLASAPFRSPEAGGEPVVLLKNQSGGGLSDATSSLIAGQVPKVINCRRIVDSDLNGDTRPDLFFADQGQGGKGAQSRLLLSGVDGRYADASSSLPQQVSATASADAADTRGDGLVDMILFNDHSTTRAPLQLLSNDGTGHFTVDNGRLPAVLNDTKRSDNVFIDGRFVRNRGASLPDLVLIGRAGVDSVVLRNDGTGQFSSGSTLPPKPFGGNANEVAMAAEDLDGDGALDLVIGYRDAQFQGGYVQVLMSNGEGTFRDETDQRIAQPTGSNSLGSLSLSGATGKNGVLLLLSFFGGHSLLKALDSRGRFVDVPLDLTDGYSPTILVDLDQDGLADIVTAVTARGRFGARRVEVAPTVTLVSPWDGSSFKGPGDVAFAATSTDPDVSISRVEYRRGDVAVAQSTQAPWTATWMGAPLGTFDLTARVTRKDGTTATSSPAQISVTSTGYPVTTTQVVPIVLDVDNGTDHFTTDLAVTNRGATTTYLTMTYTAALGSKAGSGSVSYVLAPGSELRTSSVLAYLRSRGLAIPPAASDRSQGGTLLLGFDGASSPDAVSATARTSALTRAPQPVGRAGTAYLGLRADEGVADRLHVFGLRATATDRANLAIVATSPDPVTIRVKVFSGKTSAIVADSLPLSGYGWNQVNRILEGPGFTNGYALVERVGGSGTFFAYGIVNDNATGDGSYIPPTAPGGSGGDGLTVPVLVETSSFRSELVVANRGFGTATLTLRYVESLSPEGGRGGAMTLTLAAGEQRIIPEAIDFLRRSGIAIGAQGNGNYAGALRVSVAGVAPDQVFAGARTASPSPGGAGQFGLFTPPVAEGQEASTEAYVYGLRADASSRSNLAVLNAGRDFDGPVTLRVQLFDGAGGVAQGSPVDVELGPGGWRQLSNPLAALGIESGWARITRVAGTAPWVAYGVVNDGGAPGQGTGDGAYLPMTR